MSTIAADRPGNQLARKIILQASPLFKLKESHVREAVARGLGFRTHAAIVSKRKSDEHWKPSEFNLAAFTNRLSELRDDPDTAYATGVLAEGALIDIQIEKQLGVHQAGYMDVAYSIAVDLIHPGSQSGHLDGIFQLPEFFSNDAELYRVDSASQHRVDGGAYARTRKRSGRGLLTAKLIDGRWTGRLFVYSVAHQQEDRDCLRSVKAALARRILPAVTSGVRCRIYRPDRYEFGAWRVELSLGPEPTSYLGGSNLSFGIPRMPQRIFHAAPGFHLEPHTGVISEGRWIADLYTNGIQEIDNQTSIATVRRQLLEAVHGQLEASGWAPVARAEVLGLSPQDWI